MYSEIEPELSKEQKKEIRRIIDRYLKIRFKKRVRLLTGIKLK